MASAPLLAQQGDRENDPQPDLPADIVVPPAPPLEPDDALASFVIEDGFRIELVASEPLLSDPITLTIGPDCRMWVVEMRGFMPDVDGTGEEAPVGVVAVLSDTDGDGRMDKRTEFARGLVMPRALAPAGDGVLIAEPPHLWWMRDTDGDGKADTRVEISSDYGGPGNPEHTANGLLRTLDNWIYSANHRTRLRHVGGERFEQDATVGRGQWGISQDDVGRLYYNSNSLPLQVDLFPSSYLERNPELGDPSTTGRTIGALKAIPVWPARVTPGVNRGYKTLNDEGRITEVTAACAPLIYRGGLFPEDFAGNAFICEPAGNLVKRMLVEPTPRGGLVARNAYEGREFLASTDERFRPVNLTTGPDGALYVVDMYRGIIQHRNFVTTFLRRQIEERELETPLGMGRIYRIVPDDAPKSGATPAPALQRATIAELVAALDHGNGWWRDTAQQLLLERRDPDAVPLLRNLSVEGSPLGRLHALWTLEGLGERDRGAIEAALSAPDERVQAAGVRLAEPWLRDGDETLLDAVIGLADAEAPELVRQVALSLGEVATPRAFEVLATLAGSRGQIDGIDDAIVSGLRGRELALLERLSGDVANAGAVARQAVATIFRRADAAEQKALLALVGDEASLRPAFIGGLERLANLYGKTGDARGRRVVMAVDPDAVQAIAADATDPLAARAQRLLPWLQGPAAQAAAAGPPVRPLTREEQERFDKGRVAFAVCAGCHHPEGIGFTGVAPSLVDSKWTTGPENALVRIVLHGKEGDGAGMPPLGVLDDETIAAVTTYIRRAWRQKADPISPATVAGIRATEADRDRPWTPEELERLVVESGGGGNP